jgi:hypothetical protein
MIIERPNAPVRRRDRLAEQIDDIIELIIIYELIECS